MIKNQDKFKMQTAASLSNECRGAISDLCRAYRKGNVYLELSSECRNDIEWLEDNI